jgi:hypothetical protein
MDGPTSQHTYIHTYIDHVRNVRDGGRIARAGDKLRKLEREKGIVVRFVIGHSGTPGGGALDRALDAEEAETRDFMRLDHAEGYHELSSKTRTYFTTAVATWDADFYVKVDDDIHLNLGTCVLAGPCIDHCGESSLQDGRSSSRP